MIPNLNHSDDISKITVALVGALPKINAAVKQSENPHLHNKYADITNIMEACKPALAEAGVVILQPPASLESGAVSVATVLLHESGQWLSCQLAMKPQQQTPQGVGGAITYARRYSLAALLSIPQEDDDGNEASGVGKPNPPKPAARPAQQAKPAPPVDPSKPWSTRAQMLGVFDKTRKALGDAVFFGELDLFGKKQVNEITEPEEAVKIYAALKARAPKKEAA